MDSLFDACADVVLSSSVLLAKAATDLPPKIGQYILYRACKEENDLAVQLLVENWSHPELSFDFFSNNRLCVRRELRSGCFWKPALYYGVFQEYTHQLEKNLPSILRGLFQHFYRRLSEGKPVLLQLVSLQALVIRNDNGMEYVRSSQLGVQCIDCSGGLSLTAPCRYFLSAFLFPS